MNPIDTRKGDRRRTVASVSTDVNVQAYVEGLRLRFGPYEGSADDARRVVDDSMGTEKLTDVLYKMRREE